MTSAHPKAVASNRSRSLEFRQLIAATLRGEGIRDAQPKPLSWSLADSFNDEVEQGDIYGLPGSWLLNVRYGEGFALAETMDAAEADARTDGKERVAIAVRRNGRPPEDAFIVMSLATFAAVLRDAQA